MSRATWGGARARTPPATKSLGHPLEAPAQTGEDAPGRGDGRRETACWSCPRTNTRRRDRGPTRRSVNDCPRGPLPSSRRARRPAKVGRCDVEDGRFAVWFHPPTPPPLPRRMGHRSSPSLNTGAPATGRNAASASLPLRPRPPPRTAPSSSRPPSTPPGDECRQGTTAGVPSWAGATVAREAALADGRYTADHWHGESRIGRCRSSGGEGVRSPVPIGPPAGRTDSHASPFRSGGEACSWRHYRPGIPRPARP